MAFATRYVHCPPVEKAWTTAPVGSWTTGIFGCMHDCNSCFCSCCCPCITAGQSIEITTNGALGCSAAALITFFLDAISAFTLARFFTMKYRRELRQSYQLPPTCWGVLPPAVDDCIAHAFCWQCALAQEARELKNRGWDPSISKALRHKSVPLSQAYMRVWVQRTLPTWLAFNFTLRWNIHHSKKWSSDR